MRNLILLITSGLLVCSFIGKRENKNNPPGTVQINDTLFADETEISNLSWMEFEAYNKQVFGVNSVEYKSCLPDTLVWRQKLAYNEPYVQYYYRHPAYKDYPVVGVTYEQAYYFCQWRTMVVHNLMEIKNGKRKAVDVYKPYTGKLKFEYRLPTKQEFEALAIVGVDPKLKKKIEKKSGSFFNVQDTTHFDSQTYDNADVTAPVYSYLPNKLGLYNVIGNVSELVAEKGLSKGGSWNMFADKINVLKDEECTGANSWTGFRCVCVMKK